MWLERWIQHHRYFDQQENPRYSCFLMHGPNLKANSPLLRKNMPNCLKKATDSSLKEFIWSNAKKMKKSATWTSHWLAFLFHSINYCKDHIACLLLFSYYNLYTPWKEVSYKQQRQANDVAFYRDAHGAFNIDKVFWFAYVMSQNARRKHKWIHWNFSDFSNVFTWSFHKDSE